jgi:DNA-binding response OmpR family regulator
MGTVLVVDDDDTVREVVVSYLRAAGINTVQADDGEDALTMVGQHQPDLVILDLMLPRLPGTDVLRQIRALDAQLPVIMLTARAEEPDRVLGLEIGADDYVTKPFSPRELVLRVQAVLRRGASPSSAGTDFTDGDLRVDTKARLVTLGGTPVGLTTREFDLLAFLIARPGAAFSREQLMNEVWGWQFGDQTTVTVHIRRLREKVEPEPSAPQRIATVWGVGYRWDGAASSGPDNDPQSQDIAHGA